MCISVRRFNQDYQINNEPFLAYKVVVREEDDDTYSSPVPLHNRIQQSDLAGGFDNKGTIAQYKEGEEITDTEGVGFYCFTSLEGAREYRTYCPLIEPHRRRVVIEVTIPPDAEILWENCLPGHKPYRLLTKTLRVEGEVRG